MVVADQLIDGFHLYDDRVFGQNLLEIRNSPLRSIERKNLADHRPDAPPLLEIGCGEIARVPIPQAARKVQKNSV